MNTNLLHTIVSLSQNDLSTFIKFDRLERGRKIYKKGTIQSCVWQEDGRTLRLEFDDKETPYTIEMTWDPVEPIIVCGKCLESKIHLGLDTICVCGVVALLTIQSILKSRKMPGVLAQRREALLTQLLNGHHNFLEDLSSKVVSAIAVYIKPVMDWEGKERSTIEIKRGWVTLTQWTKDLPHELRNLLWKKNDLQSFFKNFFASEYRTAPIYFRTRFGSIQLTYQSKDQLIPRTELILDGDTVQCKRIGSYGSAVLDHFVCIGSSYFVDVTNKKLGHLGHNTTQENWQYIQRMLDWTDRGSEFQEIFFDPKNPLVIPTRLFNKDLLLNFHRTNQGILGNFYFKKDGRLLSPKSRELSYKTIIRKDGEEHVVLRCVATQLEDARYSTESEVYVPQLQSLLEQLRKKIRILKKELSDVDLQQLLFGLLCVKKTSEIAPLVAALGMTFKKPMTDEWRTIITDELLNAYQFLQKNDYAYIAFLQDAPYIIPIQYKKAWRSLAIPMILFKGHCTFNPISGIITVKAKEFYKNLYEYKQLLSQEGIELYFENKQITIAQFTAICNAARPESGIDWFEIKPEISYNGARLSDADWQSLIENNGMLHRENSIQIVDQQSQGTIDLLARILRITPQNKTTRDTTSFVPAQRLQTFDLIELYQYNIALKLAPADAKLIENLINFKKVVPTTIPAQLNATLRTYQKIGYDWLSFLYQSRFGACLADDMGLGKTVQTITFLGGIAEGLIPSPYKKSGPHLIVTPPSITFNWLHEIKKFYPSLNVVEYTGPQRTPDFANQDVIITSYDIARIDLEILKKQFFNVIVFDEAHAIKNIAAKRTGAMRQLEGNFKICITGTPLENNIAEYCSIMDLAIPGVFADIDVKRKDPAESIQASIIKRTRPFILRRTKDTILKELPEKTEHDVYFTMTSTQKALYTRMIAETKRTIDNAFNQKAAGQARIIALTALLRLRQICISPQLLDEKQAIASPKIEYLVDTLTELSNNGNAALVFSQFTSSLDILAQELTRAQLKFLRIDGATSTSKRKDIVEEFQQKKSAAILLLSLKVGGVGLNLTRANHVFHIDPWWNPAVENQASDRAHRIGQEQKVFVYRLLMHHSIEEKMMLLKKQKRELFDMIMDGAAHKGSSTISKKDFDFLLS